MWRSGGARAGDANKAAPVFGVAELGGRQKEPGRAEAGLPAKGFFQAVFKEPPRRAALSGNTLFGWRWLSCPGAGAQPARRQGPSPALMGKKSPLAGGASYQSCATGQRHEQQRSQWSCRDKSPVALSLAGLLASLLCPLAVASWTPALGCFTD